MITSIEPEIPELVINNLLRCSGDSDRGFVYIEPYGNFAEVRSTIPVNRQDFILKASIPDPPYLVSTQLDRALRDGGIEITAPPSTLRIFDISSGENGHSSAVVLTETVSPPLSEIVRVTNTESVNLFAEHLLRMIGSETGGDNPGEMNRGIEAVYAFLDSAGIGSDGLYMTDGSGLSRYDALSSDFVTRLLEYEKNRSPVGGFFVSSLASAGENGTLQYYFRDEVFKGRLQAKSGTSTRIRNYAGYLKTSSGKEYALPSW
ncbi:MAG: D-alanyl-D-alanine carboxypeptidase [Bacteroidales bacterium]